MSIKTVATPSAPKAIGPYSQAVVAGGFVFCSGQIALDAAGNGPIGNTAAEQAIQSLLNLEKVLQAAGSGMDRVVKTTIFLLDMADFAAVNDVYQRAFGDHRPARATLQAARLPKDALVEIECVALAG